VGSCLGCGFVLSPSKIAVGTSGVKFMALTLAVHVQQPTSSGKRDREKVQYLRSIGSRQDKRVKTASRVYVCAFFLSVR